MGHPTKLESSGGEVWATRLEISEPHYKSPGQIRPRGQVRGSQRHRGRSALNPGSCPERAGQRRGGAGLCLFPEESGDWWAGWVSLVL